MKKFEILTGIAYKLKPNFLQLEIVLSMLLEYKRKNFLLLCNFLLTKTIYILNTPFLYFFIPIPIITYINIMSSIILTLIKSNCYQLLYVINDMLQ